MSKARNVQEIVLALRQRGMHKMDHTVLPNGDHQIFMTYYGPHTPLKYITIVGLNDIDALDGALDFLRVNGLPV